MDVKKNLPAHYLNNLENLLLEQDQVERLIEQGLALHQQNRLAEAHDIYHHVLAIKEDHFDALQLLGALSLQTNEFTEAINFLTRALKINPDFAQGYSNCGNAYTELKRFDEALKSYDTAIRLKPDYAEAYSNRGNTLTSLKRFNEAIESCVSAIRLKPNYAEAYSNLGNSVLQNKGYEDALESYDTAIRLKPDYAEAYSNRGNALTELKRFDEALASYDMAISIKPDYAEAYSNCANAFIGLKRFDEALEFCDKAIQIKHNCVEAYSNRSNILFQLKRFSEVLASCDAAIRINPDYAEAYSNRGNALKELNYFDEAIECYVKALSLKPDIEWTYGDLLHTKMKICSWIGLAECLETISKKMMENSRVATPFNLLSINDDIQLIKDFSENYIKDQFPFNLALGAIPKHIKKERICIGYFSPDFRSHPVSFLTAELFESHNRNKFEVLAFSLRNTTNNDDTSSRIKSCFDQFIEVEKMSDLQIANLARELGVDIAIDLTGLTQHSRTRIFSYRAAPIQVNWLGYPGTIGASFIDYIVADKTIIPEQYQIFYTEKVAYLPNTYIVDDSKRVASSREFTRKECELPEHAFVFCCFNNDYKFNPEMLDCWSRILSCVQDSVLWISENNQFFKTNIKTEFQNRGIDPSRIIFAQRLYSMADHLARYVLADLFLDTHPYNAHTTAVDSLKAGVPLVTLIGKTFASRVAASLLSAIQLPELITHTQEKYESLVIELATNPDKLNDIKKRLIHNRINAPLFDTLLFTQDLETAYVKMMERYWNNFPPDHIHT